LLPVFTGTGYPVDVRKKTDNCRLNPWRPADKQDLSINAKTLINNFLFVLKANCKPKTHEFPVVYGKRYLKQALKTKKP